MYPAIIKCDSLVMICPNYNDAVSANITAFINRLTAVFRTHDFSRKKIYALVISGYSGGDIVAEQIIGAMNFQQELYPAGKFRSGGDGQRSGQHPAGGESGRKRRQPSRSGSWSEERTYEED